MFCNQNTSDQLWEVHINIANKSFKRGPGGFYMKHSLDLCLYLRYFELSCICEIYDVEYCKWNHFDELSQKKKNVAASYSQKILSGVVFEIQAVCHDKLSTRDRQVGAILQVNAICRMFPTNKTADL